MRVVTHELVSSLVPHAQCAAVRVHVHVHVRAAGGAGGAHGRVHGADGCCGTWAAGTGAVGGSAGRKVDWGGWMLTHTPQTHQSLICG